ncbi:cysteine synthase A [Candidatus Haliotispira prima]|uniref:Cysteine synthase n=1 Tax=Candidatus Haliotispira prima TaxID=3034016 RepID=A0ABY8MDL3_9SPIO|nr:cysteine synthase A [Candidatus Haliotispira prima]
MAKLYNNVLELIGDTPLVAIHKQSPEGGGKIYGKLEANNPGASVKDRIALSMIQDAEKSGKLTKGSTIIEPTSGNTGIGLALVGVTKGYRVILTMPETMSIERRKILRNLGAEIVLTEGPEGMPGAIAEAARLVEQIPQAFMPSQFANGANPAVHYRTTGPEIWEALDGKVDAFVAGVGTGGTISGVGRFLKEKNPNIKIFAVEPDSSAVISGKSMGPHMIQGIGAGFIPENYDAQYVDEVIQIESPAAIDQAKKLAGEEGLLVGISSGGNVLAAKNVAQRPEFAGKNIVTILCDTGERYISTLLFYED